MQIRQKHNTPQISAGITDAGENSHQKYWSEQQVSVDHKFPSGHILVSHKNHLIKILITMLSQNKDNKSVF